MSEKKNNKKKKHKLLLVQENGVRTNSLEKYTGLGTCIFYRFNKNKKTEEKYYGYFLEGKKHGYGQYIYYNGDVYKGTYEHGKKSGIGTYIYNIDKKIKKKRNEKIKGSDEEKESDKEMDDDSNGEIKIEEKDEQSDDNKNYEEDKSDSELLKKNKLCKELIALIKNMNKKKKEKKKKMKLPLEKERCYYYGNYINGLKHNEGMMVYENGDVYVGTWKFGEKNGPGKYIYNKCKSTLEGNWAEGYLSYGKWTLPNGMYFVGRFRENKPTGDGSWIFNNKTQVNVFYHEIYNEKSKKEKEARYVKNSKMFLIFNSYCITSTGC
ncbi:conserved Plasmodium protein, unknown function [Plasmodium sp. gorilla clade G2]|uniref:conserved Plasmodium protein, unknown function n=1 Tax=Plasmodium sp. gorilla clade G2 TaxID=880535 RepID=UPI000D203261|nr:conserved Plasmodium protein, unknown function [Plasmodium sp. gorilla clade G2]SOV14713.1 conserved Plasmodium protein, unknown function [Plasmodium sp. gorilla clade G2]